MSSAQPPLGPAGHNVRRNLRRLREQRQWGYGDLSKRLTQAGLTIHTDELGQIDAGERRVDVDELVALAAAFHLEPQQLLEPPAECSNCHGTPPVGFICMTCDTTGLPAYGA